MKIKSAFGKISKINSKNMLLTDWKPIKAILIEDIDGTYVTPPEHSLLGESIFKSYKKSMCKIFLYLISVLLLTVILWSSIFYSALESTVILGLGCVVFLVGLDFYQATRVLSNTCNRARFFYSVIYDSKLIAIKFTVISTAVYFFQLFMQSRSGFNGLENLILLFGTYYPEISMETCWRFLIGPLIHLDFFHWVTNTCLATLFISVVFHLSKKICFILFFFGAILSHVGAYFLSFYNTNHIDAVAGMSGGVYALMTFSLFTMMKVKKNRSIALSILSIMVISTFGSLLSKYEVNYFAHVIGALVGGMAFIYILFENKKPYE
ncbi:rhomboid family intramembrane serine protease (plasmid) [Pseudoalteromonas sp. T1lg65]|uniref:rhomboid family intramembrane serine protease n=1 Tax=Pseudoalteromonas sp. T1lg65 TaxID=2077101 RepID=UPI003F7957B2